MKKILCFVVCSILAGLVSLSAQAPHSAVRKHGVAVEVAILPHTTTMIANGTSRTFVDVRVIDAFGNDIENAANEVWFSIKGDGSASFPEYTNPDPSIENAWKNNLTKGKLRLVLAAGTKAGIIKVEVKSNGLETASAEIHLVLPVKRAVGQLAVPHSIRRSSGKMVGADISFLPELEGRGRRFSDNGVEGDAIEILKRHGFNYIRLRIFNNPAAEKGYSPSKGFCDLEHTREMILRAKKAGMKVLLDFHYSDYWADPQQQNKPSAWIGLNFEQLQAAVKDYTKTVLLSLKQSGAMPDMVQIGNEINHGMIWPDGHIANVDNLSKLIEAGIEATRETDSTTLIMLHVALGGQDEETKFWLDNMIERGLQFDIIGLSFYPRWHGSLADLQHNLDYIVSHYQQDICLVEYTFLKKEVNETTLALPNGRGIGTCIWEPLNTWETIFDKDGKANDLLGVYDTIIK